MNQLRQQEGFPTMPRGAQVVRCSLCQIFQCPQAGGTFVGGHGLNLHEKLSG